MKKRRFLSIILIMQVIMGILQGTAFAAAPTPELFAYRIMSRSTVMQADNPIAYAFNERKDLSETKPYFEGDTAMVPVRFLVESFSAECDWESAKGGTFVVEQRNCIVVRITAGKNITADGVEKKSDAMPTMKNGTLYVPAAAFADAMKLIYKEDKDTGLLFFSRESEEERHSKVDYKTHILPYFDEKYLENEKTHLYVATNGNDETGDGSKEHPFATIDRAKLKVRELSENQKGDITVYIRGGLYRLSEPIRFLPEDSGKNGYKITYTAFEDEKVIIDGTKEVSGWKLYNGNIYVADVSGEEPIHYLYENGEMCQKARHPNRDPEDRRAGYLQTLGSGGGDIWYSMSWAEGEIPYVENAKHLEVFVWPGGEGGYWMWFSQVCKVAKFNQKSRIMTMADKARYALGAGSRYYMMGAIEFLDQEGEFYHDTEAGKLYYIPYGYEMSGNKLTIPVVDNLISIEGESQTETVRNIEISKLELRNTKRTENTTYYVGSHKKDSSGNGIEMQYAENCSVLDCYIHDVGGNGVVAKSFFSNLKINGNKIHTTALGGVFLIADEVFRADNNIVSDNLVYSTSQLLGQGQGIDLNGGGDNFAKHNRVYDVVRSAINMGNGNAGHNYAGYNDLSDANTSGEDTGIIYSNIQAYNFDKGAEATGSTIYNNFLHDSHAGFKSWSAIYSDDVSHNVRTQNNIITRMQEKGEDELGQYIAGIFGKGHNYKMINNVLANALVDPARGTFLLEDSQGGVSSENYVIERNISYNHGSVMYYHALANWKENSMTSADNNVFYAENSEQYTLRNAPVATLEEWRNLGTGFDVNSITENPQFMNEEADDFRLSYNSPAKKLGIKTIKQSTIGLSENFIYADESDEISRLFIKRDGYSDTLSSMNLACGESAALKITARTKNGFVKQAENVLFTSDAPSVAQVDSFGNVTALGAGKAKITATVYDGSSRADIDIYAFVDDEITDFKFDKETYIGEVNGSLAVIPLAVTRFGQILTKDELDSLKFAVTNGDIASADSGGNISFSKIGTTEVSATVTFGGQTVSATAQLACVSDVVNSIKIKLPSSTIKEGEEIACEIIGIGTGGKEISLGGYECSLTSTKDEVLRVGKSGGAGFTLQGKNAGKTQLKASVSWLGRTFETTSNLIVTAQNRLINNWNVSNYTNSQGFAIEDENGISIYSSGWDIYRAEDDFTFVYREENATDLTVEATVKSVDTPQTNFSSTGVMLRQEDTAGSFNVNLRYLPNSKSAILTWRSTEFPSSKDISVRNVLTDFTYSDPVKIRLQKKGDVIIASCMDENGAWHVVQEIELSLKGTYLAGVTSFSGNNEMWFESRAEDVKIYEGVE